MEKRTPLKHLEYFDGKFILKSQTSLENFKLINTIPQDAYSNYFDRGKNLFELRFDNNSKLLMSYYQIKASGQITNFNKRIQLKPFTKFPNNCLVIGVYPSGNKNCYVLFNPNDSISNANESSLSIWIKFFNIYYCLKKDRDVLYFDKDRNCKMFFTSDITKLFNLNESIFYKLSKNEIKEIIHEFNSFNNLNRSGAKDKMNQNTNIINELGMDAKIFIKDNNNFKQNKFNQKISPNKEMGRLAEQKFYEFIKANILNNIEYIKSNLKIKNIDTFDWINKEKEEFRPFDFLINNNIFIDVKGTHESVPYFELSENEYNFRKKTIEDGNKYFVVSILNLSLDQKNIMIKMENIKFFDHKKLEEMNFKQKTKYIYDGENNG